jgi:uncharacterized protein DUF6636
VPWSRTFPSGGFAKQRTVSYSRRVRRMCLLSAICLGALSLTGAAVAKTPLPGIRSPSGNISCLYVPGGGSNLLCAIKSAGYAVRLQERCMGPGGSGVDWHGFELGVRAKGDVLCTGGVLYNPGTQRPTYATLAYGTSWRHGVFACVSRVTGITCRNAAGHGVFVSRESWRTW